MTISELRKVVKQTIIAQGGKLYGFNINNIQAAYGVNYSQVQNAISYFAYSPQQAKFRAAYNFHN